MSIVKSQYHFTILKSSINSIRQREGDSLCDCKIVCKEKTFQAHKVILAGASLYFDEAFEDLDRFSFPVIFLKDVPTYVMALLLDYIYMGETIVSPENLNDFMGVATFLKIRGLFDERVLDCQPPQPPSTPSNDFKHFLPGPSSSTPAPKKPRQAEPNMNSPSHMSVDTSTDSILRTPTNSLPPSPFHASPLQTLEPLAGTPGHDQSVQCSICQKMFRNRGSLKRHIINIHLQARPIRCEMCPYVCRDRSNLNQHLRNKHKIMVVPSSGYKREIFPEITSNDPLVTPPRSSTGMSSRPGPAHSIGNSSSAVGQEIDVEPGPFMKIEPVDDETSDEAPKDDLNERMIMLGSDQSGSMNLSSTSTEHEREEDYKQNLEKD